MKVLVAGATGAIGRQLVPMLVQRGHEVVGTTRTESKRDLLVSLGAKPVVADALDPEAVGRAVSQAEPEVIIHELTAIPTALSMRRMERDFAPTNRLRTEGTDHLLSAAQAAGARRFVAQSFASYLPGGAARSRAARAAADQPGRRPCPASGDGGLALAGVSGAAGAPLARAAGSLPAARGVRLPLRADRRDRRSLLAADVVLRGDGGGRVPAIAGPRHGRSRVARTLLAWARAARVAGVRLRRAEVNGQPGAITLDPDGRLISVIALDVVGAQIQAVNSLVNPDKLDHLGLPVVEPNTGAAGVGREGSEA